MSTISITLTSMGFSLKVSHNGIIEGSWINIGDYIGRFAHRKWDQVKRRYALINEYFHYDRYNQICYLPRFELQRFCEYLRSQGCVYKLLEKEAVIGAPASFLMLRHVQYKNEKQKNAVDYLTDEKSGPVRGLGLQTGLGKTVSFIWALQKLGTRSLITMTSRLEQWISEIDKYTNLTESDLYLVQGQGSLSKLFSQIDQELNPKIILASTQTIKRYIGYDENYQHLPHFSEICEKLNVGVIGTDEYHEHFYTNFLIGIMANPKVFIPITATFTVNDKFVKDIFDQFIPKKIQFAGGEYERYVNVTSYRYDGGRYFLKPHHYSRAGNYSQVKFEDYLLSKKGLPFLDQLIKEAFLPIIRQHYINIADDGEKLLFICSTREFCDYLARVLKSLFKNKTVSVFYSGMPLTILEKYDIILSTPGSSGTGRDIKNLRTCFVFENTQSEPRNLQFIGRLRRLEKNTPEFVYIWLSAIPKHNIYNNARSLLYGNRALQLKHFTL